MSNIYTIIFLCSVFLFSDITLVFAQAGIRAQGRDVNLGRQGQTAQGLVDSMLNIDHRQQMRKFIRSISKFSRRLDPNFIVMTQDGLELLEKGSTAEDGGNAPSSTYIQAIDGVLIKGLNFRPPLPGKDDIKTDAKDRKELLRLAKLGKKRGLQIWVSDYAPNKQIAKDIIILNKANGFIPFATSSDDNIFNSIPSFPPQPIDVNPKNVTGLKFANNFLYLTDSSNFDRQEDFVLALSNTNYDAVITDVFHRGRRPFTKNNIRGFKFKKVGARRLVFARVDIGHADSSRYYWKPGWKEGSPPYIGAPTPTNPDKYYVRYWYKAWQDAITGTPKAYVYGIFKQGFDGVVIDGINAYSFFQGAQ